MKTVKPLDEGLFVTTASDKTMKIWQPVERPPSTMISAKPLATLQETETISHLVVMRIKLDVFIVYVTGCMIKILSIEQG